MSEKDNDVISTYYKRLMAIQEEVFLATKELPYIFPWGLLVNQQMILSETKVTVLQLTFVISGQEWFMRQILPQN